MSAPVPRRRHKKGFFSRREFLTRSGGALASLGMIPILPGCDSNGSGGRNASSGGAGSSGGGSGGGNGGAGARVFRHGVASGDPLSDRIIFWTRVTQAGTFDVPVTLVIATDPSLSQVVTRIDGFAVAARDFTVKIDATGLQPATTYYYQFSALDQQSPVGRSRSLPVGQVDRLRIAVLSCSSYAHGFFNAYARVAQRADLDLVLHLGDYVYEYGNGEYGTARTYEPPHEMVSLEDYRTRHGYYKLEPELQELHRQHPMICVWDDHESTNDSWEGGAENHQPQTEGDWPTRKSVAQRTYEEWLPTRTPDPARIFRQFQIGELAELLMLDSRLLARSEPIPATATPPGSPAGVFLADGPYLDPTRTLLGAEQESWLFERMRTTSARWKLLGQQVMFGQLKLFGAPNALGLSQYLNPDQWDGYPVARDRVFAALRGNADHAAVDDVVVLTGDIHTAWAMDLTEDPNNSLSYNPATGNGSAAVEFVTTSVTSPGLEDLASAGSLLQTQNPHMKFIDLASKGYLLLDITSQRCQGEFWAVDEIANRSTGETFLAAYQTQQGSNHIIEGTQTEPRGNPPAPAP